MQLGLKQRAARTNLPGDRFTLPEAEDISTEVRQVLRDAAVQVWEAA